MDNKNETGGQDRTRINVNEDYELQYWSEKFDVSPEELKQAVDDSGSTQADEVEKYLSNK